MLIKRNFREKLIKWLFYIRIKKVHIEYYPSGKKKSKGSLYFLQDHIDEKDGKWTEWYENGKKKSQGSFSNGTVYGQWTYWYESGQKKSKGGYIWVDYGKGKGIVKDDNWIYWDEDGNKKNIFQDNQE
mgnify:FL=1|jgi:antitoxin component YwqK of YwqJK toxin-antitoxin module